MAIKGRIVTKWPGRIVGGTDTNLSYTGGVITITAPPGVDGVFSNVRLAKTALYTVSNGDTGKTIALAGNALYTLTFGATSGYSSNFAVKVVNEDTWATGRGKRIASTSGDFATFILWPGQTVTVYIAGTTLRCDPAFQRARLPGGTTTFKCFFGTGSDTLGDGLGAAGAGSWATVQGGLYNFANYFDFSSSPQSTVILQMQGNEIGGTGAHMSTHAILGGQGGAVIVLDGNGALYQTTNANLAMYHGQILQIRRIIVQSTGGDGNISVNRGAYLYVLDGVIFNGNSGGADLTATDGGIIEIDNDFVIAAANARTYFIINSGGTIKAPSAVSANILANQAVVYWVVAQDPGVTNLNNVTWISPGAVAGTAYFITANHVLYKSATHPGTIAGSTTTGGQAI